MRGAVSPIPPYTITAWYLVKHQEQLIFAFINIVVVQKGNRTKLLGSKDKKGKNNEDYVCPLGCCMA
jgi:hypothetical protein